MDITTIRTYLVSSRKNGLKWREVGKRYPGVPLGTLCRIAKDANYEPKDHKVRHALGLEPLAVEVLPCPIHGVVHVARRCPSAPTKYQPHPVKRITAIKSLLNNKYLQS